MSQEILSRLEAVTSRLEALAGRGGGGDGDAKVSEFLTQYDEFYSKHVTRLVTASVQTKYFTSEQTDEVIVKPFKHVRVLLEATTKCKKPTDQDLWKFLQPISDSINAADKLCPASNDPKFNHRKAIFESIQVTLCFTPSGMYQTTGEACQGPEDIAMNNINRILKAAKENETDRAAHNEFARSLKDLFKELKDFVKKYFKGGLDWNPKGVVISSFTAGGASDAPAAPEAPAAPDAPAAPAAPAGGSGGSGGTGGMAAVFGQINKGDDSQNATQAFGLKKVKKRTAAEKEEDRKKAAAAEEERLKAEASKPKEKKEETKVKAVQKKPPELTLSQGTWFCKYYEGEKGRPLQITIPEVQMKQSIYILNCMNVIIQIPDKCKGIQVDGCKKTEIYFQSVVSTFQIVNSIGCKVTVQESAPSVAIDKTSGFSLILTASSVKAPPEIVTSNVSELNLVVPGPDGSDPIEIPLPEQYTTKFNPETKKLVTEPVTHGG